MYIILWEYHVKPEHIKEFEEIYSSDGAWARLFQKSKGFLKTELIKDEELSRRYITIDQWASMQDYEVFRSEWKTEYAAMDAEYEHLTERESLLGQGESVLGPT